MIKKNKKKLLVLGATSYQAEIVKKAKKYDFISVITLDNIPDNIAHKLSDKSVNISTMDLKNVLEFSKNENIDAIITGASDVAIPTLAYVSENLKLKGISFNQSQIFTNKELFRSFQKENRLLYPDYIVTNKIEELYNFLLLNNEKQYIIKPIDSSGSKGILITNGALSKDELLNMFNYAVSNSFSKNVIIEEYIAGDDYSGEGFFLNGKLIFLQITEKLLTPFPYRTPLAHIIKKSSDKINFELEINEIFQKLSVLNGPFDFDAKIDLEGNIYILEVSPRTGGNGITKVIEYATGIDLIDLHIRYLLGMNIVLEKYNKTIPTIVRLLTSSKKGFLKENFTFKDKSFLLEDNLKEFKFIKKKGDKINEFKTGRDVLGYFILQSQSEDFLLNKSDYLHDLFSKELEVYIDSQG